MSNTLPIILMYLLSSECMISVINDDSNFTDSYPSDTNWVTSSEYVGAIEIAFNIARAKDSTVSTLMTLPTQALWDGMDDQQKALYLLNRERYDRGLKPFEGYHSDVVGVAQNYAQLLYDTGTFGHEEDGTPWQRLDRVPAIANYKDFFSYAENLAAFASSSSYTNAPISRSIYNWIYDDGASTGWSWGHRKFCLAKGLNDNSGKQGQEGVIGFGIVKGTAYDYSNWNGAYSTIVVMDAFDPGSGWNHANTQSTDLCMETNPPSQRFTFDYDNSTITNKQSGVMWTLKPLSHDTPENAAGVCTGSSHAGYNDWQLPTKAISKIFHATLNAEGRTPPQLFEHCTAEVVSDGYVRTKRGADSYGGTPGDSIGFSGGANIRCYRNVP